MVRTLVILALALAVLPSCEQESDNAPKVSPTITYRTDSGYTWTNDTVGMQDSLLVGVTIQQGTDPIAAFLVRVAYDGQSAYEQRDSIAMGADTVYFEAHIVTRAQAGSEKWMFGLMEDDGDYYFRPITLTVQ